MGHCASSVSADDIVAERHRGIRPGFGYPACPDHSEKFKLFDLLGARDARDRADRARRDDAGRERQRPVLRASRSALFHRRPDRRRSDRRLCAAQGHSIEEVERWLTSQLAYEPANC